MIFRDHIPDLRINSRTAVRAYETLIGGDPQIAVSVLQDYAPSRMDEIKSILNDFGFMMRCQSRCYEALDDEKGIEDTYIRTIHECAALMLALEKFVVNTGETYVYRYGKTPPGGQQIPEQMRCESLSLVSETQERPPKRRRTDSSSMSRDPLGQTSPLPNELKAKILGCLDGVELNALTSVSKDWCDAVSTLSDYLRCPQFAFDTSIQDIDKFEKLCVRYGVKTVDSMDLSNLRSPQFYSGFMRLSESQLRIRKLSLDLPYRNGHFDLLALGAQGFSSVEKIRMEVTAHEDYGAPIQLLRCFQSLKHLSLKLVMAVIEHPPFSFPTSFEIGGLDSYELSIEDRVHDQFHEDADGSGELQDTYRVWLSREFLESTSVGYVDRLKIDGVRFTPELLENVLDQTRPTSLDLCGSGLSISEIIDTLEVAQFQLQKLNLEDHDSGERESSRRNVLSNVETLCLSKIDVDENFSDLFDCPMPHLRDLSLNWIYVPEADVSLAVAIKKCPSLEVLTIKDDNDSIDEHICQSLGRALAAAHLSHLQTFKFFCNAFTTLNLKSIFEAWTPPESMSFMIEDGSFDEDTLPFLVERGIRAIVVDH